MPVKNGQRHPWIPRVSAHAGRWIISVTILALLLAQCGKPKGTPYRYLAVKGPQALLKIAPMVSSAMYGVDSGQWNYVPLKPGEVLYSMGDNAEYFFRNDASLPDSLDFTARDSVLVLLNGRPFALHIPQDGDILPVLRSLTQADMGSIRCMRFSGDIQESYLPWLDSLSRANPHIDIHLESDSTDISLEHLAWLADHFRPRFLITHLSAEDLIVLNGFEELESLYLSLYTDSSAGRQVMLPHLSSLRHVDLSMNDDSIFVPTTFFRLNPQLESLSIKGSAAGVLGDGRDLQQLRALYLTGEDSARYLPPADSLKRCRVLSIESPLASGIASEEIIAFKNLEELGLPADLPKERFEAILSTNPQLRSLSIFATDTLVAKDYAVLQHLKKLRVLQITGKHGSVEPLRSMKQLDFLSLPEEFFKDSAALTELRKALPDTKITPNGGFCMGSGWVLLFWPLVLMSIVAWKRMKPSKANP